jgi:hypothetical protein
MAFKSLASWCWIRRNCAVETLYSLLDDYRRNLILLCSCTCRSKALTSAWRAYLRCLTFTQVCKSKPTDVWFWDLGIAHCSIKPIPRLSRTLGRNIPYIRQSYNFISAKSSCLMFIWSLEEQISIFICRPFGSWRPYLSTKYGPSSVKRLCFNILTVL